MMGTPDAPWQPIRDPNRDRKRGLLNEALRLERQTTDKIRRPPKQIPDNAITGATLLVGGS